jgi:hypothetical protein
VRSGTKGSARDELEAQRVGAVQQHHVGRMPHTPSAGKGGNRRASKPRRTVANESDYPSREPNTTIGPADVASTDEAQMPSATSPRQNLRALDKPARGRAPGYGEQWTHQPHCAARAIQARTSRGVPNASATISPTPPKARAA